MPFRVQLSTRAGEGWPAHRAEIIFLAEHKHADYVNAAGGAGARLGEESSPSWRTYSLYAALTAASFSTLAIVGFFVSWFHNGGSPHGLTPSPGVWKSLGRIFSWTLGTSVLLAICGKGKTRLLVLGWSAAAIVATALVFMLEMD
jgi:hypothetical protein